MVLMKAIASIALKAQITVYHPVTKCVFEGSRSAISIQIFVTSNEKHL